MKSWVGVLVLAAGAFAADGQVVFEEKFARAANGVPEGWEGAGNPHAKGRLFRELKRFDAGQWCRFEVRSTVSKIPNPPASSPRGRWSGAR